jgi:small-conductance mechanosensitive channel
MLHQRFSLTDVTLDQLSILLSLSIYLLVMLVGLPFIALQWGFNRVDVSSFLYRLFTNIQIGSIQISLFAILFGALLFVVGYIVTRQFQAWLDRNVMARSRVDEGVRNSISTVTGYLGIGIAAILGDSAAGFNLSSLAFVAGALSLGIGFGLQNIVNNFVSGLILLAERPFKVGDWIVTGQTAGTVKRISVRATEIETFQKQTVILPNSDLINQAVGNWTHRNHMGRVDVAVSVAYGTNPRMVHDLLLDIADADPSVLKVPAPFVVFMGFGESALNFELRFHVRDVLEGSVIATRIRFAIVDAFDARNIQMPFPQRDLNIKTEDLRGMFDGLQEVPKPAKTRNRAKAQAALRGGKPSSKPSKA